MSYFNRHVLIIELLKMFQPICKIVILERNHVFKKSLLLFLLLLLLLLLFTVGKKSFTQL